MRVNRMTGPVISVMLAVFVVGCASSEIGVRKIDTETYFRAVQRSALNGVRASEDTEVLLRQRDLAESYSKQPIQVIEQLDAELCTAPSRDLAVALAELCFLEARDYPPLSEQAMRLYMTSLLYSHACLFDDQLGSPLSKYDPRFRLACDLYNQSLARAIDFAQDHKLTFQGGRDLDTLIGKARVTAGVFKLTWPREQVSAFIPTYHYRVTGIRNHYRTAGLGVSAMAIRKMPPSEHQTDQDRFMIRGADPVYPFTLMVHVEGSILRVPGEKGEFSLTTAMFDPMDTTETAVADQAVPLETDMTTPLAYLLQHSPDVPNMGAFFDPSILDATQGLYMLHPYEKGKIPILFVHGLISEPLTWMEMLNDLQGDEKLRERYQFWLFLYPTGNPIPYSAAVLREELMKVKATFDPDDTDPAFDDMVLVGHSLGGVLSRLMITDSENHGWEAISDRPFDEVPFKPQEREFIRKLLFFEPVPFINRVVFIASPHRGANLADQWFAIWAARLVKLPLGLVKAGGDLVSALMAGEGNEGRKLFDRVPTSIEGLQPENPLNKLTDVMKRAAIPYHSIIANKDKAGVPDGSDGVVPYWSAHLDEAKSEIIIKDTHGCTRNPHTIREVHRILKLHLEGVDTGAGK